MKLASLKSGRDGKLIVVSRDLTRAADASDIVPTLQGLLDEWDSLEPEVRRRSIQVNEGDVETFAFDSAACAAPLPRAFQWADGALYTNHVALMRKAAGADVPDSLWAAPMLYQGGSDSLLGPCDPVEMTKTEGWGVDFEAQLAVIIDDTPMGTTAAQARERIKLMTLVNDVSLRGLVEKEIQKGYGLFHAKPVTTFGPCAVTPDELGVSWDGGKAHLPLISRINGATFGRPNAGVDMTYDFPNLIAHACATRHLCAGALIGSGAVSNREPDGKPARMVDQGGVGYSCIAELRMVEALEHGKAATPYLSYGDRVEIEMLDPQGRTIFGKIDQTLVPYEQMT